MIEAAKHIAAKAHGSIGQVRKYSGLPYVVHTIAVADIVARHGGSPHMIAAAHLHDVLEDTPLTATDVFDQLVALGIDSADAIIIVKYTVDLSDVFDKKSFPAFNRVQRKEMERGRQSVMSDGAKFIKMADCIDNAKDIMANDPGFGRVFVAEVRKLFPLIKDAHKGLADELHAILYPVVLDYSV